jgi:hypothetical protein
VYGRHKKKLIAINRQGRSIEARQYQLRWKIAMKHSDTVANLFFGKGFSFDDIVVGGELGGIEAVRSYLKTRRAMCARVLAEAAVAGQADISELQRGVHGFDEALKLLPKASGRKVPPNIRHALGAYSLLGV